MADLRKIIEKLDVHTIRIYRETKERFDKALFELKVEEKRSITQDEMLGILLDIYFKERYKGLKEGVK
jgi:hypothetical protein